MCSRLLTQVHARLFREERGVRGSEKQPGKIRTTQNWIGGSRPGNARFVPPPPERVPDLLSDLDRWIHADDTLPPLIRAGLAHVQFETIHPFLDGNGRIGRLLITLLVQQWELMEDPLLYLSLAFKRHRAAYYERLAAVRTVGDQNLRVGKCSRRYVVVPKIERDRLPKRAVRAQATTGSHARENRAYSELEFGRSHER